MSKPQGRKNRIQVLVTDEEKNRIVQKADDTGLSVSSYLRRLVLEDLNNSRRSVEENGYRR